MMDAQIIEKATNEAKDSAIELVMKEIVDMEKKAEEGRKNHHLDHAEINKKYFGGNRKRKRQRKSTIYDGTFQEEVRG